MKPIWHSMSCVCVPCLDQDEEAAKGWPIPTDVLMFPEDTT